MCSIDIKIIYIFYIMSRQNVMQNHPLIPREQTYVLDRKILSIHSNDRDINKWPLANNFEVNLPEPLTNVQSMRLVMVTLPNEQYVFSNEYQNTQMTFTVSSGCTGAGTYTIAICEGSYEPEQLAAEIQTKMNNAVAAAIPAPYDEFRVYYNPVTNRICFGHKSCGFSLDFNVRHKYPFICRWQVDVFKHYLRWGLPAYLGYDKKVYTATLTPPNDSLGGLAALGDPFGPDFLATPWLDGAPAPPGNHYIDCSQNAIDIDGDSVIYMEMEKYNTIDEIEPYSENTMGACNNDYNGKVNSAFAKIPVSRRPFGHVLDSINGFLGNVSQYQPPIERIVKLRFRFRYHDGRFVDFRNVPFSFSLEMNMLRDEQPRAMRIRVPQFYNI